MNAFGYLIPNMFIVVLLVLSVVPLWKNRRNIPFAVVAILMFTGIYMGGMILLSGKGRYFLMAVPGLMIYLAYCYTQWVRISWNQNTDVSA